MSHVLNLLHLLKTVIMIFSLHLHQVDLFCIPWLYCTYAIVVVVLYIRDCGDCIVHARLWWLYCTIKRLWWLYCTCASVVIVLYIRECGDCILHARLWWLYCTYASVVIVLYMRDCGDCIVHARLWWLYCTCAIVVNVEFHWVDNICLNVSS